MQRCVRGRGQQRQPLVVQQVPPPAVVRETRAAVLSFAELSSSSDCSRVGNSNSRDKWSASSAEANSGRRSFKGSSRLSCCNKRSSRSSSCLDVGTYAGRGSSSCCASPVSAGVEALRCVSAPEVRGHLSNRQDQNRQQYLQLSCEQQEQQLDSVLQQGSAQDPESVQQPENVVESEANKQLRSTQLQSFQACAVVGAAGDAAALRRRRSVSSCSSSSRNQDDEKQTTSRRRTRTVAGGLLTFRRSGSGSNNGEVREKAACEDEEGKGCTDGETRGRQHETTRQAETVIATDRETQSEQHGGRAAANRETKAEEVEGTLQAKADQVESGSLSACLASSQQWVRPFLRQATVYGLRHLLLRLLQLQRRAFLSSCLDPTQRVTHLLSHGRLKAERHTVCTADGYQLFFYRLRRVCRHCCCCGIGVPPAAASRLRSSSSGAADIQEAGKEVEHCSSRSSFPCGRAHGVDSCCACVHIEDSSSSRGSSHSDAPTGSASASAPAGGASGRPAERSAAAAAGAGLPSEAVCPCCAGAAQGTDAGESGSCRRGPESCQRYCCCCRNSVEENVGGLPGGNIASRPRVRSACTPPPPASPGDTAARSTCSSSRSNSPSCRMVATCSSKGEKAAGRCSPRATTGERRRTSSSVAAAAAHAREQQQQQRGEEKRQPWRGSDQAEERAGFGGSGDESQPHAAVQQQHQQEGVNVASEDRWAEEAAAAEEGGAGTVAGERTPGAAGLATAAAHWRAAAAAADEDTPGGTAAQVPEGAAWTSEPVTTADAAPAAKSATTAGSTPTNETAEAHGWWRERVREASAFAFHRRSSHVGRSAEYGPAVLMQHGLLESSLNWVSGGCGSLAFMLAYEGCDVWLGNNRGNEYTRLLPAKAKQQQQQHRCKALQSCPCRCLPCRSSASPALRREDAAGASSSTAAAARAGDTTAAPDDPAGAGDSPAAALGGRTSTGVEPAAVEEAPRCRGGNGDMAPRPTTVRDGVRGDNEGTSTAACVTVGETAVSARAEIPIATAVAGRAKSDAEGGQDVGRCCSGERCNSGLFYGRSGRELEACLRAEIALLRQQKEVPQFEQSLDAQAGVLQEVAPQQRDAPRQRVAAQQQQKQREPRVGGRAQDSGERAGTGAGAAAAGAARQPNELHACHSRRRRTAISSSSLCCCSALCCHCTGLTAFPVFGEGVGMQMQRQQLSKACLDACAVLLQLLGRCHPRSLIKRREDGTVPQAQKQQLGMQRQEQRPGNVRECCLQQVTTGLEEQQPGGLEQQYSSPGDWLPAGQQEHEGRSFPQRQQRGMRPPREKHADQLQQEQGETEPCGDLRCAAAVQEESRPLGRAFWRGNGKGSCVTRSLWVGQSREESPAVVELPVSDGAGAIAADPATANSNHKCGGPAQQGQPEGKLGPQRIEEQHWREQQQETRGARQMVGIEEKPPTREVLQQTEEDLETGTHEDGLSGCSTEEDDVPPFHGALRSASSQPWTYRDMAAYDVPAMLDYILSVRQKERRRGTAGGRHSAEGGRRRVAASRGRPTCAETYPVAVPAENRRTPSSSACPSVPTNATSVCCVAKPVVAAARRSDSSSAVVAPDAPFSPATAFEQQRQHVLLEQQQRYARHQRRVTQDQEMPLLQKQKELQQERSGGVCGKGEALHSPMTKQSTNGFAHKEACSSRTREKVNNSCMSEDDEEEEKLSYCDDSSGDIWAVGQSQGAAQLLAMLALYPALGLMLRGVVLFSPPVVLQSPSNLTLSARMFINLALQMPEKVLLGIRVAEQLLPVPLLSLFGDFVAGKRLMGFYTGSISWQQRCINFRYTPSGGTSKRNFDLWVGSMGAAGGSSKTQDNTLGKKSSSSNVEEKDNHAALSRNEEAALANAADAPAGAASVALPTTAEDLLHVDAAAASKEGKTRLGREHDSEECQEAHGDTEVGRGSAASYPLERICCPVFALLGGKDNLVEAGASSAHLSRCLGKKRLLHVEIWEENGHLDFGWACARRADLYPRLIQLILSRKYSRQLRKYCLQLLQQQQKQAL